MVAALCLCVGSTSHGLAWPTSEQIYFRREPVLLASLIGAALAAAGVAYQAVLRNPLADPYLLGVSSGASLAAYLWRFTWMLGFIGPIAGAISQQAMAFIGAAIAVAIVLTLGTRRGKLEPVTLLLVGVVVNAVNGAVFLLINSLARDITGGSGGALNFLIGGIQTNLTFGQEMTATVCTAIGFVLLLAWSGRLNAAVLGDDEASSLGIRVHQLRWATLVTASIVTAAAVAISGPIGFVGLIAPHAARRVVGPDVRRLLPVATAFGAMLLAAADAVSRALSAPSMAGTLIPVGVLTGLMGGPFFLFLLYRNRRLREVA